MRDLTYKQALENAAHLKALGQTEVYLYRDDSEFPYDKVTRVDEGSSWRLSGPSSVRLSAEESGLTFTISVDFEGRDANGKGVSLFDRDRLRDLMRRLPEPARLSFADMLARQVLPPLIKRTSELREDLNSQADSEDCVRGLIAFARAEQVSA